MCAVAAVRAKWTSDVDAAVESAADLGAELDHPLHGAQRLAVRWVAAHVAHVAGAPDSASDGHGETHGRVVRRRGYRTSCTAYYAKDARPSGPSGTAITTTQLGIAAGAALIAETSFTTTGSAGLVYDYYAVDRFKQWAHSAHITLRRGERSLLADFASDAL